MAWEFIGSCIDGQTFLIGGIDVWKHKWEKESGSYALISDPRYGQNFEFNVYQILSGDVSIRFAAGEFSNTVWGFYREQ